VIELKVKRVYDDYDEKDGYRILVDRLWPRGLGKEKAKIDLWIRDIAPSNELRKWFSHDPMKWEEFKKRYFEELDKKPEVVGKLVKIIMEKQKVTLLFSAKDKIHNNCVALKEYLLKRI